MATIKLNRNDKVRKELEQWRKEHFNAKFTSFAKHIDLHYQYLVDWYRGRFDMADKSLEKIEKFIRKHSA